MSRHLLHNPFTNVLYFLPLTFNHKLSEGIGSVADSSSSSFNKAFKFTKYGMNVFREGLYIKKKALGRLYCCYLLRSPCDKQGEEGSCYKERGGQEVGIMDRVYIKGLLLYPYKSFFFNYLLYSVRSDMFNFIASLFVLFG